MVIEVWQLISLMLTFLGALTALGRVLLIQIDKRLDQRFDIVERDMGRYQVLEQQFSQLRADLPVKYVLREDYVRNQTVIEAKLDSLALKLENIQLRGLSND